MATIGTYYLNGPNLVTSTGIFTTPAFTTSAPNGWYSQEGIVRQLQNGILLPRAQCPSCDSPCGSNVVDGLAGYGLYLVAVDLGATQGAVKVTFDPKVYPQGIRAIYNNTVFNKFSSEQDGYHGTTVTDGLTYMGNSATEPNLPLQILLTNEWEYFNGAFAQNGTNVDIYVSEISSTTGKSPDECIAYIPKPLNSPSTVQLQVAQVINNQNTPSWNLTVECPTKLTPIPSTRYLSTNQTCNTLEGLDFTIYLGKVSGAADEPVVHDWVFQDEDAVLFRTPPPGQTVGYYKIGTAVQYWLIETDVNGVITVVTPCP
jgi:hypothetical protein|tara:strand:+ start:464 stop:1408 length:945 start_codon:yes stop_codon:yes gene_type:complete